MFGLDPDRLRQTLDDSGKVPGDFHGFLHGTEALSHAYEKFRFTGGVDKPPFDEVYTKVKAYLKDILPEDI